MKQPGVIYRVINDVGLENVIDKGRYTPSGSVPLVNNENGVPSSGSFNYISVLGILIHLSGHTSTDIAFAANSCAIYMFFPKHFNGEALKRIGWYLKMTWDRGLILNTNRELFNIDSYSDAYFSGMYGHENPTDPTCVKSCTGYVITF